MKTTLTEESRGMLERSPWALTVAEMLCEEPGSVILVTLPEAALQPVRDGELSPAQEAANGLALVFGGSATWGQRDEFLWASRHRWRPLTQRDVFLVVAGNDRGHVTLDENAAIDVLYSHAQSGFVVICGEALAEGVDDLLIEAQRQAFVHQRIHRVNVRPDAPERGAAGDPADGDRQCTVNPTVNAPSTPPSMHGQCTVNPTVNAPSTPPSMHRQCTVNSAAASDRPAAPPATQRGAKSNEHAPVSADEVSTAWMQGNRLELLELVYERIADSDLHRAAEDLVVAVNHFEDVLERAGERERAETQPEGAR